MGLALCRGELQWEVSLKSIDWATEYTLSNLLLFPKIGWHKSITEDKKRALRKGSFRYMVFARLYLYTTIKLLLTAMN